MTGTTAIPINPTAFPALELSQQIGLTELVRGREQEFLARMTPFVLRQNLLLDLGLVERIDAAGISALISLHLSASEAGYHFAVVNPSPRVAEILALVGLDQLLVSHNAAYKSHSASISLYPAA